LTLFPYTTLFRSNARTVRFHATWTGTERCDRSLVNTTDTSRTVIPLACGRFCRKGNGPTVRFCLFCAFTNGWTVRIPGVKGLVDTAPSRLTSAAWERL